MSRSRLQGIGGRPAGAWPVIGTSRGPDAGCLYGLNTQHDPWQAPSLAWRTSDDDDGLLSALCPVDLLFELSDPMLALGPGGYGVFAIRLISAINLSTFQPTYPAEERHQCVQLR